MTTLIFGTGGCPLYPFVPLNQRKIKGQQLKGQIVSALFHTFWHFSTHFHTYPEFCRIFPRGLFLRIKGFTTALVRRDKKEQKKIKRKRSNHFARELLHVCPPPTKRGSVPWFSWLVTENPSREIATKDHSSSNPRKWNPRAENKSGR